MAESARGSSSRESSSRDSGVPVDAIGRPAALTPADIRGAQFGTTRLRTGYDMDEVDAFLDFIEEGLAVLLAELQRAQEGEAQYRAQYEQLRARVGAGAPTTVVRAESPGGPASTQEQAQALAQALLIRQALIAQLREHVTQVESQIRSVQASVAAAAPSVPAPEVPEAAAITAISAPNRADAQAETPPGADQTQEIPVQQIQPQSPRT